MKTNKFFNKMKKLVNYFKSLFSNQKQEKTYEGLGIYDIFGVELQKHDVVYVISYDDYKRRGYYTLNACAHPFLASELTPLQIKQGVVRENVLIANTLSNGGEVKLIANKRGKFYHIYK